MSAAEVKAVSCLQVDNNFRFNDLKGGWNNSSIPVSNLCTCNDSGLVFDKHTNDLDPFDGIVASDGSVKKVLDKIICQEREASYYTSRRRRLPECTTNAVTSYYWVNFVASPNYCIPLVQIHWRNVGAVLVIAMEGKGHCGTVAGH